MGLFRPPPPRFDRNESPQLTPSTPRAAGSRGVDSLSDLVPGGSVATAPGGAGTYESVEDYYGRVLASSKDLKTSACTASGKPPPATVSLLRRVPLEVREKFYGCGAPLPPGIDGLRVLDLGSGSGRDCYVAAGLVGERGRVTGVDMTREQLDVARRHAESFCTDVLGYAASNLDFVEGHIEYLDRAGIADESQDLVLSNCVINLSPDKARVLRECHRVLAWGGELHFSDVYCDRRLPESVRSHEVLWGECVAGALYVEDFRRLALAAGFRDVRVLASSPIEVTDPELAAVCGEARFRSITYRCFKLPQGSGPGCLEDLCEDYGQYAVYRGTVPGSEAAYQLDDHHRLVRGKPFLVCGNTAAMLGEPFAAGAGGAGGSARPEGAGASWLHRHFDLVGDRETHYGAFDCGDGGGGFAGESGGGGGGGGGSCC